MLFESSLPSRHCFSEDKQRTPKQWHIQSLCGTPSSRASPAHLFHREASAEATAFVRQRLRRVLPGQTKSVLAVLRRQATPQKLASSAEFMGGFGFGEAAEVVE